MRTKDKYKVGYIGETKSGLKYVVIEENYSNITIKFLETGYILKTNASVLSQGYIKDKLKPSVCNIGYLGYCDKPNRSKEYKLWKGIIERCYNSKRKDYQLYGRKGVTVCERWKCFANFLDDIEHIDGYNKEKFYNGELDLDKDIKQKDVDSCNKIYSLDTCMFVDKHKNRGFITRKETESKGIVSAKDNYALYTYCPVEVLGKKINVKTQYINRILNGGAKKHKGWSFAYIH